MVCSLYCGATALFSISHSSFSICHFSTYSVVIALAGNGKYEMKNNKWKMVPTAQRFHCSPLTAHCSLLYIFMQQLNLVSPVAQLNPQQVPHRKHPDPLFIINDW